MNALQQGLAALAVAGMLAGAVAIPAGAATGSGHNAERPAPLAPPALVEPAPALAPADVQRAVAVSYRALGLQTKMPSGDVPILAENVPLQRTAPSLSQRILNLVFWIAAFGFLAVLLLSLRGTRWSNSQSRSLSSGDSGTDSPQMAAARMDKAATEADTLALEGSFAEAMHALLLQSVLELRRRLDISIAVSLTSREILHLVTLPPEGRAVFADIIGRVEISHFGTHEPDAADYLACRTSFETLRALLGTGGAA